MYIYPYCLILITQLFLYTFFFFVLHAKQIINNCCLLYSIINQMFITRYKNIHIFIDILNFKIIIIHKTDILYCI